MSEWKIQLCIFKIIFPSQTQPKVQNLTNFLKEIFQIVGEWVGPKQQIMFHVGVGRADQQETTCFQKKCLNFVPVCKKIQMPIHITLQI